ncbi:irregular chiasm C-roughest protein isoform X1 [Vespula squamosa]|uniref:Irregular chiasm C-roughest protein isoform X1 n=1 Tax=Vespula squamosa TaxID=30214 RepID=A0ABD2AAM4_VESSQ
MAYLKQTSALTLERLRFESSLYKAPRGTYLLIDGRRLDPGNQFVPVKEGSELTLECAAEGGNPPPVLAWGMILSQATLDGPEQPPDNLTVLPSTSARHSGAHLKVLRGHHNATIVCVARHVTLTVPMNASILLDVQFRDDIVSSSVKRDKRMERQAGRISVILDLGTVVAPWERIKRERPGERGREKEKEKEKDISTGGRTMRLYIHPLPLAFGAKRKAKVRVCDVILCSPPPTLVSTPPTGWLDFLKESKLQAVFAEKSKERGINSTTRTKTVGIVQTEVNKEIFETSLNRRSIAVTLPISRSKINTDRFHLMLLKYAKYQQVVDFQSVSLVI